MISSNIQLSCGGVDILETTGSYVSSAEIVERLNGWKSAKIFIEDESGELEKLLGRVTSVQPALIKARYGVKKSSATEFVPWETWVVLGYRASIKTIILEIADILYLFTGQNKVSARKGKISDAVKSIVDEVSNDYGIDIPTEIESTVDHSSICYQTGTSDLRFIVDRMCPRAINNDGASSYKFWCRAGVICFATLDYVVPRINVNSFRIVDKTRDNAIMANVRSGAAGVTMHTYDLRTAQVDIVESIPNIVLKRGDVTPSFGREWSIRKFRSIGQNGYMEARAMAQWKYEVSHEIMYQASFFHQDHIQIRAGDPIIATLNNEGEPTTIWNGLWTVGEIVHSITNDQIDTAFKVFRGEQHRTDSVDQEAPGRTFRNITKTASSRGVKQVTQV